MIGKEIVVTDELDGYVALALAMALRGKWTKQRVNGIIERDTEKVKRIYKIMIAAGQVG